MDIEELAFQLENTHVANDVLADLAAAFEETHVWDPADNLAMIRRSRERNLSAVAGKRPINDAVVSTAKRYATYLRVGVLDQHVFVKSRVVEFLTVTSVTDKRRALEDAVGIDDDILAIVEEAPDFVGVWSLIPDEDRCDMDVVRAVIKREYHRDYAGSIAHDVNEAEWLTEAQRRDLTGYLEELFVNGHQ